MTTEYSDIISDGGMDPRNSTDNLYKTNKESIIEKAIYDIIVGMTKMSDAPASAETHLANAVVQLNKIVNIQKIHDPELDCQLIYCNELIKLTK